MDMAAEAPIGWPRWEGVSTDTEACPAGVVGRKDEVATTIPAVAGAASPPEPLTLLQTTPLMFNPSSPACEPQALFLKEKKKKMKTRRCFRLV